jgi:carboxylate-amine ligase
MMENKWRAARYGISGKLIDFGKQAEVPFTELARELLEFIDDVVDELGSREEINYIFKMIENGTGADRQIKTFYSNGENYKKLVDYIVEETYTGLDFKPSNNTSSKNDLKPIKKTVKSNKTKKTKTIKNTSTK